MGAEPVVQGNGVWLPMSLADRLFACYYGGGPRHREAPSHQEGAGREEVGVPPVRVVRGLEEARRQRAGGEFRMEPSSRFAARKSAREGLTITGIEGENVKGSPDEDGRTATSAG